MPVITDIGCDNAGHVTRRTYKTYIIPENFKTISVGDASSNVESNSYIAGDINANILSDTLNINPQNKWILLEADDDNNTLKIGHKVDGVTKTTDSVEILANSFTVELPVLDEAGHITELITRTYILPDLTAEIT